MSKSRGQDDSGFGRRIKGFLGTDQRELLERLETVQKQLVALREAAEEQKTALVAVGRIRKISGKFETVVAEIRGVREHIVDIRRGLDQMKRSQREDSEQKDRYIKRLSSSLDAVTRTLAAGGEGVEGFQAIGAEALSDMLSRRLQSMAPIDAEKSFKDILSALSPGLRARLYAGYDFTIMLDYPSSEIRLRFTSDHVATRAKSVEKEPFTVRWIEKHVRPGEVLYDVGANVGAYSLIASRAHKGRVKVYAFEPVFASYADLCWNVLYNACEESVVPLPFALAGETGPLTIGLSSLASGAASHDPRPASSGVAGVQRFPFLAFRLDDLISATGLPVPNHIKLDVDGAELDVLKGAISTLRAPTLRSLLVELNPQAEADGIRALIEEAGLQLKSRFDRPNPEAPSYALFTREAEG